MTVGILVCTLLPLAVYASFCGPAAIPFSFESLPNGAPVLGCARPARGCFGTMANGRPAASSSTFYRVNKKPDGYFRKNGDTRHATVPSEQAAFYHPQTSKCATTYDQEQCTGDQQWLGGIGPVVNATTLPLAVQCCEYEALRHSSDRGIAIVNPGQIVIGGEVQSANNEREYAFDYISNVVKSVKEDGTASYDVSVRRMPCVPHPSEFTVSVEPSVTDEITTRFGKPHKTNKAHGPQAFQAPTQYVGAPTELQEIGPQTRIINSSPPIAQERIEVVQGPFVAESDAIVEEVQASEGLELPPNQVPQGLIESQPQPGYAPSYAPAYGSSGCGAGGGCSGGGGGGGGGTSIPFCFSADSTVQLANGRTRRMDELQLNDWVLSASSDRLEYASVTKWTHRSANVMAEFHRIELTDGKILKITGKHYLYKTECTSENEPVQFNEIDQRPVYAENVQVGDCLYTISKETSDLFVQRRVKSVKIVTERGVFAPMTSNSDLVVNDVYVSCYTIINHGVMQQSFFDFVRSIPSVQWLLGEHSETTDLPFGTSLILDLMSSVLPKALLKV